MELITHCEQQINEKKKKQFIRTWNFLYFCHLLCTKHYRTIKRSHKAALYIYFFSFFHPIQQEEAEQSSRTAECPKIIIITIITASCRFTQEYSRHVNNVQVQSVAMIITVKRNYAERLALRRSRGFARGCGKPGSYERAKHAKRGLWSDSLPRLGVEKFWTVTVKSFAVTCTPTM